MHPNEPADPDTAAHRDWGANASSAGTAGTSPADGTEPVKTASPAGEPDLAVRHAELSDAYLRTRAEMENVRRRAEDDVAKARKFAVESFAESLLPVKDSLEAAIAIPGASPEQLLEGVHATLRQLASALERNRVQEIAPQAAAKFDPHQHQAISVVPAAGQEPGTVVAVLQKGYLIAERVLRPALVTVAQG